MAYSRLWFALNLLSLHYKSQPNQYVAPISRRCDLLWIYYLCTINHNGFSAMKSGKKLWFALNLLSLHYKSQHARRRRLKFARCDLLWIYYLCTINHNFAATRRAWSQLWFALNLLSLHYKSQPRGRDARTFARCDLLWIYYLCTINHNMPPKCTRRFPVVICFEFIIFAL